jgi:hypothetical protein
MPVGASLSEPNLISASTSSTENIREPQTGQKRRPSWSAVSPVDEKADAGQMPKKVKAEPLSCLQSVQWQMPILKGSPVTP